MNPGPTPTVRVVAVVEDDRPAIALVGALFRSYAAEFADSIAETLRFQKFEDEVAALPGRYGPPSGALLLAIDGERPAGCVGLRDLGGGTCEMKRLYVPPSHRGRGVGRLLVEQVVDRAARMGHRRMVLDTFPDMAGALALYRSQGFVDTGPYWGHPDGRAVFLERTLVDRRTEAGGFADLRISDFP